MNAPFAKWDGGGAVQFKALKRIFKCSPKLLMDFYLALIYNCAAAASTSASASAIHMSGLGVWRFGRLNSNRKKALISNGTWNARRGDLAGARDVRALLRFGRSALVASIAAQ